MFKTTRANRQNGALVLYWPAYDMRSDHQRGSRSRRSQGHDGLFRASRSPLGRLSPCRRQQRCAISRHRSWVHLCLCSWKTEPFDSGPGKASTCMKETGRATGTSGSNGSPVKKTEMGRSSLASGRYTTDSAPAMLFSTAHDRFPRRFSEVSHG